MSINPIQAKNSIVNRYLSYLKTTFFISNKAVRDEFIKKFEEQVFSRGPLVEIGLPFLKGASTEELINEGILSPEFQKLNTEGLPINRSLYLHQEKAIHQIVKHHKNGIIATGTGSGKTESFLIPILDHLMKEKASGTLKNRGVRALFLYPMNALVNDQLKRFRCLLKNYPDITFGSYTGNTKISDKEALEKYFESGFSNDCLEGTEYQKNKKTIKPLINEKLSREAILADPPHLLLTNYAMLEYLLLRPRDNPIFEGNNWTFFVLDEIHTYNGAKGIEIAMLLRRLKERVGKSEEGSIRCIGTSATLSSEEGGIKEVINFAQNIFSEPFDSSSIISGDYAEYSIDGELFTPKSDLYAKWSKIYEEEKQISSFVTIGKENGVPLSLLNEAEGVSQNQNEFLFNVLKYDSNIIKARNILVENNGAEFSDVSLDLFQNESNPEKAFAALIDLAVHAKGNSSDLPLLPAKYHLFIRSPDGAFIAFTPTPTISLEPCELIGIDPEDPSKIFPSFEFGLCRKCGSIYLVGYTKQISDNPPQFKLHLPYQSDDFDEKTEFFLLTDYLAFDSEIPQSSTHILCNKCGAIKENRFNYPLCRCKGNVQIHLTQVQSTPEGLVHKCEACKSQNTVGSLIMRFTFGKDALSSVLATDLFQITPPNEKGFKKLLAFSDSRQDSSFFAAYLSNTYQNIQKRALITQIIQENSEDISKNEWALEDLNEELSNKFREINEPKSLDKKLTPQQLENLSRSAVLDDFLKYSERTGPEGLGLFTYVPFLFNPNEPIFKLPRDWNLTEIEKWHLFCLMADIFRDKQAMGFFKAKCIWPVFTPRNFQGSFKVHNSNKSAHVYSWIPLQGVNRQLDIVRRIIARLENISMIDEKVILQDLWDDITLKPQFKKITIKIKDKTVSSFVTLEHQWKIISPKSHPDIQWYICDTCKRITIHSVKGVCPSYRCNGTLVPCNPEEIFEENHYRQLALQFNPYRFEVEEHNAQLKAELAEQIQQKFINCEIDALICSTTFELGVDIGELETVFLKNTPPSPANYIQRAGRAGRRQGSAALILTFCPRSSHDRAHFSEPKRMVRGIVKSPIFTLENEKIIKRHLYSTIFAGFFRENKQYFDKVESFILNKEACHRFESFVKILDPEIIQTLNIIIPDSVRTTIFQGVIHEKIYDSLFNPEYGAFYRAVEDTKHEIEELMAEKKRRNDLDLPSDFILSMIKAIKQRDIISYLSANNLIPKYGFPVDLVELFIRNPAHEGKDLDLCRDLKIAISEYAPGSQIVARKQLWTSRYVKKHPTKGWREYNYAICPNCKGFERKIANNNDSITQCSFCGFEANTGRWKKGIYIVPDYGFINDIADPKPVGNSRPEKFYSSRVYYNGDATLSEPLIYKSLDKTLTITGKSGVRGKLIVINDAKKMYFSVCTTCGYADIDRKKLFPHKNYLHNDCKGAVHKFALGHEFLTDIVQLDFGGYSDKREGFWESIMYALLEGVSYTLDIERGDIDGCLYYTGNTCNIILYDDVPGGAGLVRSIIKNNQIFKEILINAYRRMTICSCGGDTADSSCYGCLQNYRNQYCHASLKRSYPIEFLRKFIPKNL